MDQASDESSSAPQTSQPTRRRPEQRRLRENALLLGSNQTYKDVILDGVKNWLEENQVA